MKKSLLTVLAALSLSVAAFAQATIDMTGIVTFSGPGVVDGENDITITFYPAQSCVGTSGNLTAATAVNMHGSVAAIDATVDGGLAWQGPHTREWNKDVTGAPLQNSFTQNADGSWSKTINPRSYFVTVPTGPIAGMAFVLNGATDLADATPWDEKGEARYDNAGVATCGDFKVAFPVPANLLSNKAIKRTSNISQQNSPNPFRGSTTISYNVRTPGKVSLKVFNVLGEVVSTLVAEKKNAGTHRATFNAAGLNSGVYFYTTAIGNVVDTKKMLLVD